MSDYRDNIDEINGIVRSHCDIRDKVFAIERLGKSLPKVNENNIDELIKTAKPNDLFEAELKVINHFCNGIYARELYIPKDTVLVGKIHKYENLNMLIKGRLKVLVDDEIREIDAPFIVISPAGTKRIAYAVEDSVWVTIHRTDEMDLNKIEEHFIAQSEQEWLEFCKREPKLPLYSDEYQKQIALVNKSNA